MSQMHSISGMEHAFIHSACFNKQKEEFQLIPTVWFSNALKQYS